MDRYELAWRIWCWEQGYGKAEDREGLTNWMRNDQSVLHPKDIEDRDALLLVADDLLKEMKETESAQELKFTLMPAENQFAMLEWLCSLCNRVITDLTWHSKEYHHAIIFKADLSAMLG
jgi:hypothetical protein